MQTIEQQALDRVMKARAELILTRRFYGVLVSNVEPVISRRFPTAATDGRRHYWNPEFVMSLTQAELLGVQAHESEHDARHHGTRRGARLPVEWNEAGDYSINIDLIAEGFTLPKGALIDERYRGMSSEDIYRTRELDKQQDQPQDDADEDEGDDQPGENADTNPGNQPGDEGDSGDEELDSDEPCDEPGDADGDDGEGNQPGEGAGDEAGDEPGKAAGKGAGEGEGEGEGEGTGEGGDAPGEAGAGAGEPGKGEGKPSFEGNFGEVLDSATGETADGTDSVEEDARWDKIVRQAASMAKAVGQLPGHITREIERANNPPRDWRDELREFAEQGALRIETWNRPNRRHVGRGMVLPSTQKDGVNKAAFLIDTSASCDQVALAAVNDEAQQLLDDGIVDQVVVVYGDVAVTRVDEYSTGDEIEFDPRGGGGTKMRPLFDYVASEHDDASLIICFTDMYVDDLRPEDEPACPVLFAVHGYPQTVKSLIANAPWGARGIDVGVH